MLKEMSSINTEALKIVLNGELPSKEKVDFFSLREDFFDGILREFISPIEREDLYILVTRLEDEFILIYSFGLLKSKNLKDFNFKEILKIIDFNNLIFDELKNFKTPKKLLKMISENKKVVLSEYFNLIKNNSDSVTKKQISEFLLNLLRCIYGIDSETEKIILKNN